MKPRLSTLFAFACVFLFCSSASVAEEEDGMKLTSPAFKDKEFVPRKFTCQGYDMSPPLEIANLPLNTKSLVLIVDDPDAPGKTWTHWVVFDIPVINKIEENKAPGKLGLNDFGKNNYGGPCPPKGTHRYYFKLYALDEMLNLEEGAAREEVEEAMREHILEQTELMGVYKKSY